MGDGDQVAVGHLGPFMTQKLGDAQSGVEQADSVANQLLIGTGGIAVAQAVVGHRPGRTLILDFEAKPYKGTAESG